MKLAPHTPPAPWLAPLQRAGAESFATHGLPGRGVEAWRYTPTRALAKLDFTDAPGLQPDAIDVLRREGCCELVFINGRFAPSLSRGALPEGVVFSPLSQAEPDWATPLVGALATAAGPVDAFTALNAAAIQDGAALHIRGDARAQPIHLLCLTTASDQPVAAHPRNLIVLDDHAAARLIQTFAGQGVTLTNAVTEVQLAAGAQLEHVVDDRTAKGAYHVGRTEVSVGRDARYQGTIIAHGAGWIRRDHSLHLAAPGAFAQLDGLYLAAHGQHVDHHTRVLHDQPHGTSKQTWRGIIGAAGRAVFDGAIRVARDAQRTDGALSCNNLLLADDARVDAKPELEIYADDVKCSHGTTVGQLDADALFYLQARGLSRAAAEQMLLTGFVAQALASLPTWADPDGLRAAVAERLASGDWSTP